MLLALKNYMNVCPRPCLYTSKHLDMSLMRRECITYTAACIPQQPRKKISYYGKKKKDSHLAGLEPATFRLTAERANRLRHKCLLTHWPQKLPRDALIIYTWLIVHYIYIHCMELCGQDLVPRLVLHMHAMWVVHCSATTSHRGKRKDQVQCHYPY